ncbi:MAG: hypothetical protein NC405_05765 [Odoribacter sp.]|nr:hypothetical protein [Odoribacter sp.]
MRKFIAITILALVAAACGHSDSFVVKGRLTNGATTNLRIIYYSGHKVMTGVTAATDGGFAFEGKSPSDALIEIYDNEYRLLGRTVARNGQDVEVSVNPGNISEFTSKGNEIAERWTSFTSGNKNTTGAAQRNAAIARYVGEHPGDPLSAFLIMTEFDSTGSAYSTADSLLTLLTPEARAEEITAGYRALLNRVSSATSHSTVSAIPYITSGNHPRVFLPREASMSLIAISTREVMRDSVLELMRDMRGRVAKGKFAIMDFSVDADTISWSRGLRRDSVNWPAGWIAGSISGTALGRLGIPATPYYIIVDSDGRQLWRGTSAYGARQFIKK